MVLHAVLILFIHVNKSNCYTYTLTDLWECPDGYLLFQDKCFKLFRESKSHIMAHRHCESVGEGGQLAAPHTHMQVTKYFNFL